MDLLLFLYPYKFTGYFRLPLGRSLQTGFIEMGLEKILISVTNFFFMIFLKARQLPGELFVMQFLGDPLKQFL